MAFEPHYSGERSSAFWHAINKLERGEFGGLYAAALLLQNAEGSLLTWLNSDLNRMRGKK